MLASKIYKAYKTNTEPFPKNDIPTLLELSIQVVADNFSLYPHLPGVRPDIKDRVIILFNNNHLIIDHCKDIYEY